MKPNKRYPKKQWYLSDSDDPSNVDVDVLCAELLEWSQNEEAFKVSEFVVGVKKIPLPTFMTWIKKSEKLKTAYDMARSIIGDRREKFAAKGIYNPQLIIKTMPLYDAEFRDMLQWQSQLRAAENACIPSTANQRIVVLDKFPDSKEVPSLKGDDDGRTEDNTSE